MAEFDVEKEMAELGLPDDLELVALNGEPAPTAEAVARIKQMTLARVQPRRPARRRWLGLVAAAAAVLVVITGIAGPQNVLAGVQRWLSYVPGVGVRESAEVSLAATGPVRLERGSQWVEVAGVLVSQDGVTVHVTARNVQLGLNDVTLEGLPLTPGGGSTAGAGGPGERWDGWYTFTGKVAPDLTQVVVVLSGSEPWRFTVPLVPADRLAPVAEFGPAAEASGYTVQAQVLAYPDRSDLTLLVRGGEPEARVRGAGYPQPVTLSAGPWRTAKLEQLSLSGNELFRYEAEPIPADADAVTVTVPSLSVYEPGEASVRLDVADRDVNETLQLGRWTLKVVRTEVVETGLRVYVEPEAKGAAKLETYGRLAVNGEGVSHHTKLNERTWQMEWLEFPVPAGARSVKLSLSGARVNVAGPWVIEVPVQR